MNSGTSCKIFVVDDDSFCKAIDEQHVQNMGFRSVFVFIKGEDVLANFNQQPDLIFLEYNRGNNISLDVWKQIKCTHS